MGRAREAMSEPLNLRRGFDVEIINMSTGTVSP